MQPLLRVLAVASCLFGIAYGYFYDKGPQWVLIGWNIVFIVINVVQIALILRERSGVSFTEEEKELYETLFQSFAPFFQASAVRPAFRHVSATNFSRSQCHSTATCGSRSPRCQPCSTTRPCRPISMSSRLATGSSGPRIEISMRMCSSSPGATRENRGSVVPAATAQRAMTAKKPDDAIAYLQTNLEYFPKSARTYQAMAQARNAKGDRQCAISNLEKAVELDPKSAQMKNQLQQLKGQ